MTDSSHLTYRFLTWQWFFQYDLLQTNQTFMMNTYKLFQFPKFIRNVHQLGFTDSQPAKSRHVGNILRKVVALKSKSNNWYNRKATASVSIPTLKLICQRRLGTQITQPTQTTKNGQDQRVPISSINPTTTATMIWSWGNARKEFESLLSLLGVHLVGLIACTGVFCSDLPKKVSILDYQQ